MLDYYRMSSVNFGEKIIRNIKMMYNNIESI